MVKNINFFTVATGKYRDFIVPYVTSVLFHNPQAFVEILVDDVVALAPDIVVLNKLYPGEFKIRPIDPIDLAKIKKCGIRWSSIAATLRFLTVPSVRLEYTYIGDVDVLILQKDVRACHIPHMALAGIPYSNMVRKNQKRLTGLHCVRTADYYNKLDSKTLLSYKNTFLIPTSNLLDEHLLYKIVNDKVGIPDILIEHERNRGKLYRPYHGVHCTLNMPGWYGGQYKVAFVSFMESTHVKRRFLPLYRSWYINKLQNAYMRYKKCRA